MAKCEICELEMLKANGCLDKDYKINGKIYPAVRHEIRTWEEWMPEIDEKTFRCHDCGCKLGEFHHTGCDMERCPCCGGQFISCDCDISDEIIVYPRGRRIGKVRENH